MRRVGVGHVVSKKVQTAQTNHSLHTWGSDQSESISGGSNQSQRGKGGSTNRMKRVLTNGNGACGFTLVRRSTLNLTRLNHDESWRLTIYNDVCATSHRFIFCPLGLHTHLANFLVWISTSSAMSAVLLSSIAMDRLTAREVVSGLKSRDVFPQVSPLLKRTGACRNLFGPVDDAELQRELTSKLEEIAERDRLRWNFDFSEGRPLDGELEWEESPAEDCPTFYREKITTAVSKEPRRTANVPAHWGCRSTSVNELNRENKADKRNPRRSRKTAAHARTKRLADLRITGKILKNTHNVTI